MCIFCYSVLSCSLTKIGRLRKMKWLAHCWMVRLAAPLSLIFLYSILTWIPLRITLDWAALVCGEQSWIAIDVTQVLASQSHSWGVLSKIKPKHFINATNVHIFVLSLTKAQQEEKHEKCRSSMRLWSACFRNAECRNKTTFRTHSCTRKFSHLRIVWI